MPSKNKPKKMSAQYNINHAETTIRNKPHDQSRQQLCLTAPAKDTVISPISQTTSRIESSLSAILDRPLNTLQSPDSTTLRPEREVPTVVKSFFEMQAAQQAIEAKARQFGWIGAITSELAGAGSGYVTSYEHADIYYSKETGAHIVYGDILAKYNLLGAATSVLGLPVTDETGTPDGIGRYNHFQAGSIYWTPNTGPMVVRGAIRDKWASQGWELGPLGYPVSDPHRKGLLKPITNAEEYYGTFQKGALNSRNNATATAFVAELLPHELTHLVRKMFDKALKEADEELGIEGGINILNVSDWGFDFWASRKRMITYEINGFFSNGIFADPTFRLELQFLFGLDFAWQSLFGEASVDKTLVIYLQGGRISASNSTLLNRLNEEVPKKFPFAVRNIPAEILLIDILVTPQGGLQFLIEQGVDFPGSGSHRRDAVQSALNQLIEE